MLVHKSIPASVYLKIAWTLETRRRCRASEKMIPHNKTPVDLGLDIFYP